MIHIYLQYFFDVKRTEARMEIRVTVRESSVLSWNWVWVRGRIRVRVRDCAKIKTRIKGWLTWVMTRD